MTASAINVNGRRPAGAGWTLFVANHDSDDVLSPPNHNAVAVVTKGRQTGKARNYSHRFDRILVAGLPLKEEWDGELNGLDDTAAALAPTVHTGRPLGR